MKTCQSCFYWSPNHEAPAEQTPDGKYPCNKLNISTAIDFGCTLHVGSDSTEVNVPQHIKNGVDMPPNHNLIEGVEILIVTHAKDFPWLRYCCLALLKHCSGFQGVTILIPDKEAHECFEVMEKVFQSSLLFRLQSFHQTPGKGMLHHMVKMAEADSIVPKGTRYVMHLDADCIYHTRTTPENYFHNDKPVYVVRTWDSLTTEDPNNPGSKVVSDCLQWRGPTEKQLGFVTDYYTMCRHPTVLPIGFYAPYRAHIEKTHHQSFTDYMLSGRNEFPQDRMDWTTIGGFARRFMFDAFHWIHLDREENPGDRQFQFWSHGGITPEIKAQIEGYLK